MIHVHLTVKTTTNLTEIEDKKSKGRATFFSETNNNKGAILASERIVIIDNIDCVTGDTSFKIL
jgi:acyl dehydratase